ncbi:ABC transporter ATP-binding protein [Paenibacillus macerans]|uniref:ABC transporter ATP-binding protein n=1 Tax=Paenibacillus macerans TaxID=44252 RepID=UPI003D3223FC
MEAILEVDRVTKRFRNQRGINQISLDVGEGEIMGMFGQNGAGKTTLLKTITGLCRPDEGTIRLFGYDLVAQFEQAMHQVGCVIEAADAYDYMTGKQNLRQAARYYPQLSQSRVDEVLEQTGLAPYKNERAKHYSLGMKQRLALAAALLPNPKLVILDEPTNGLDIEGMVELRQTIERLAREAGIGFLISSHMLSHLEPIVTKIGIIHHGDLVRCGNRFQLVPPGMPLEDYYLEAIQAKKGAEEHGQFAGKLA